MFPVNINFGINNAHTHTHTHTVQSACGHVPPYKCVQYLYCQDSNMSEERLAAELYSTPEAMVAVDPVVKLPPLSVTDHFSEDVIYINPLTPPPMTSVPPPMTSLPALEYPLWIDSGVSRKSGRSKEGLSSSVKDTVSVGEAGTLFGPELLPTQAVHRAKVTMHQCSECSKVFGTNNALNKHLLTHQPDRPHVCNICQRGFKRHDHLTGHMLTHQKRAPHHCPQPGCQKTFHDLHSLRRHCSTQHGLFLLSTPSQPHAPEALWSAQAPWKHIELPTMAESSLDYHSFFLSPLMSVSGYWPEDRSSCGDGRAGFASVAANLESNCYQEEPEPTRPKPPEIGQAWDSLVGGVPCDLQSAADSATFCEALPFHLGTSNHDPRPVSRAVDPPGTGSPKAKAQNIHGWDPRLSTADLHAWKEMLSVQPCTEASDTGLKRASGPVSPRHHRHSRPILLKHSTRQPKHKQHIPHVNMAAACSGPPASRETELPLQNLPQASKPRKKRVKKTSTKTGDVPLPPLPAPRPSMQKRPKSRHGNLVSPSQVAMASFNREGATSLSVKASHETVGRSVAAEPGDGGGSGDSTYLKYPTGQGPQSSLHQAPTTSSAQMDTQLLESMPPMLQGGEVEKMFGLDEKSSELQLSPLVIPVSVPVAVSNKVSPQTEQEPNISRLSRKCRRPDLVRTLIIPPAGGQGGRASGGYPSQLRSPGYLADHLLTSGLHLPRYTPPPMLSPLRPGTGLYFNTLSKHQPLPPPPAMYAAFLDGNDGISLKPDNTVVSTEPRINLGARFQADVPPLRNLLLMLYDEHPAQLVWAPWGDLPSNLETQHRVTVFLDMCCSSVLPGGGTNVELALHCLHEVQGDTLAALDLLLLRGDYRTSSTHPLSGYHYAGSDHWSAQEMRTFRKALLNHNKDFQLIHNVLQTKSVAQCVEYYYAMKKVKKFKQRTKGEPRAETLRAPPERTEGRTGHRTPIRPKGSQSTERRDFTCEECGRSFHKVKSRSAHMKTHKQREKESFSVDSRFSGDHRQGQGGHRSQVIWNPENV
ncbi:uncharacterized protein znf541 isoform X2 [Brachyhypopomus gauderio]|uniref:uncharacterized protein znf541 isoform X2 n=1 Tax=Brachyhypopomus gauderio TaxID=698409 RepID=UPI004041D187